MLPNPQASDPSEALLDQIAELTHQLTVTKTENADLEILLENVTEHATNLERELYQKQQIMLSYIQQVDQVTAAAAAFENDSFEPQSLNLVAAREDELGRLARVFQIMAKQVKARQERFKQQVLYEQLLKELEAAQKIQANILPQERPLLPDHPQAEVAAIMIPAKEVGGDFFDAFALDSEHVCIAIGDVSGKGIPAALFMVRVITLLRMSLSKADQFESMLPTVNQLLCSGNDDCMFVTMFVGLFNVTSGKLTYVNGGHNAPFFARKGRPFELLQMPKGILLGINEDARYEVAELILQPGDRLVLYTDGVTEAENTQGDFFSEHRTAAVLNTLSADSADIDAAAVVNTVQESVFTFSAQAPQSDDLTLLVLRHAGVMPLPRSPMEVPGASISQQQMTLLRIVLSLAWADGSLAEAEVDVILSRFSRLFAITADRQCALAQELRSYLVQNIPLAQLVPQLRTSADRELALRLSYEVISASARTPDEQLINQPESEAYQTLISLLQLPPAVVQQIEAEVQATLREGASMRLLSVPGDEPGTTGVNP
jgi:serine phosphatase RsbU (regulator of sigma subunit)